MCVRIIRYEITLHFVVTLSSPAGSASERRLWMASGVVEVCESPPTIFAQGAGSVEGGRVERKAWDNDEVLLYGSSVMWHSRRACRWTWERGGRGGHAYGTRLEYEL